MTISASTENRSDRPRTAQYDAQPLTTDARPGRAAIAIHIGYLATGVMAVLLGPLLPSLQARFGASDAQAGTLFAALFGTSSLFALAAARNLRASVIAGMALMALGVELLSFGSWRVVTFGAAALGAGGGLMIPAANLLIAQTGGARRAAALNWLNATWGLGAILSPLLLARLQRWFGLEGALHSLAATAVLVLFLLWLAPITPRRTAEQSAERAGHTALPLIVVALSFFVYVGTEQAVAGWTASHAARMPGGAAWGTHAVAFFWGALVVGRALATLIVGRLGELRLHIVTLLLAGIGIAVMVLARSPAAAIVGAVIAGAGLAPIYALYVALLARFCELYGIHPRGWVFAAGGLGGAALPWLTGIASDRFGALRFGLLVPALGIPAMLALLAWSRSLMARVKA